MEKKIDTGDISRPANLYPQCLVESGAQGLAPLNLAMQHSGNDGAVLAILALRKKFKCTAFQQDVGDYRRLPIHNAIFFGASAPTILDIVDNHILSQLGSVTNQTTMEKLPIHLEFQHGCS
mmetsp:Transcript_28011/g.43551  ORF Transcript_28011/g.43551 Transcript_28011/m.43551 type:complete len:121 (+) Transcript_28011:2362-2724(+)